jgi:prepilin-type N-terminal cleavage/methylation domain-containing protein
MKHQKGFTLVELGIVLAVLALITVSLIPKIMDRMQQGHIDAAIEQARSVLQVCEVARKTVLSSQVDVNGVMHHTYPTMPNFANTTILQGLLGKDYNLPLKNAVGYDILVKFDSARCYVAVDLPVLEDGYGGFETTTVSGKTRVIISTKPVRSVNPTWVIAQKKFLHDEETR